MGRLTLNPLKHLDPIGTIMMAVSMYYGVGFGWAKPVPINPMYYKRQKAGTALVSIAGPVANFLLAFIFSIPSAYIYLKYNNVSMADTDYRMIIFNICVMFLSTNITLAVFNLIPMPPLDGSKILAGILPTKQYYKLMQYERYVGMVFLIILLVFPTQFSNVLSAVANPVMEFMIEFSAKIVGIFV